jgi:transcriptional regulator with XRE-family HTH domain
MVSDTDESCKSDSSDFSAGCLIILGRDIRKEREARGWSQTELAVRAGVSLPTVTRVESGKKASATTLEALAAALDSSDPIPPKEGAEEARQAREAVEQVYGRLKILFGLGEDATDKELAEELGLSTQHVCTSKQRGILPLWHVLRVCAAKGVSFDEALGFPTAGRLEAATVSPERGMVLSEKKRLLLDAIDSLSAQNQEQVYDLVDILLDAEAEGLRRKKLRKGVPDAAVANGRETGGGPRGTEK